VLTSKVLRLICEKQALVFRDFAQYLACPLRASALEAFYEDMEERARDSRIMTIATTLEIAEKVVAERKTTGKSLDENLNHTEGHSARPDGSEAPPADALGLATDAGFEIITDDDED
jgi:hypothetical protein